jgi:hypothetical protein
MEQLAAQIFSAVVSALIAYVYVRPVRWITEKMVRKAMEAVSGSKEGGRVLTDVIFDFLSDCRTFFRRPEDEPNELVLSVKDALASNPIRISDAVWEGQVLVAGLQRVMPWIFDSNQPSSLVKPVTQKWVAKTIPPLCVAIVIWSQSKPFATEFHNSLRRGDFSQFNEDTSKMAQVVEMIRSRFGASDVGSILPTTEPQG